MSGNEYVSQLRAERDRLREVVARVEGLAAECANQPSGFQYVALSLLRKALSASSPSAEQPYTETDVPAPTGAYAATGGAGDGV